MTWQSYITRSPLPRVCGSFSEAGYYSVFVGCLTSQQHESVSQGRICSHKFTCCHTEAEVADRTFYLIQSQNTDTGPTNPSADPIMPGAWQGSHWSANFWVNGMTRPRKIPTQAGFEPGIFHSRGRCLTTRPMRWYYPVTWCKLSCMHRTVSMQFSDTNKYPSPNSAKQYKF